MQKVCPKCYSTDIEEFDMAQLRQTGNEPIDFIGVESPKNYKCNDCDWQGEIKE